jgi:hypothetical protein
MKEHTLAVVEPSVDDDTTVDIARETVARGGEATIIVLLGRKTAANIAAFADSENLGIADGREIYLDRLAASYTSLFGNRVRFVEDGPRAERVVFDEAARGHATSVVMPQRLVGHRNWKSAVSKSQVPVLLAPRKAA